MSGEIAIVDCTPVAVAVPRRARDLVRVLRRTYRGKAETAGVDPHDRARDTTASTLRQLRGLAAAGPSAALDDATQEVFLVVHRRLGEFEGRAAVTTWLFGIARRVAHVLPRRGDAAERRVVVGAEVRAPDAPVARGHEHTERR